MPELIDDPLPKVVDWDTPAEPVDVPKSAQERRIAKLEEKMKQLQGLQGHDPNDLSLHAKVKVPKKFKISEFDKYNNTTSPRIHFQIVPCLNDSVC